MIPAAICILPRLIERLFKCIARAQIPRFEFLAGYRVIAIVVVFPDDLLSDLNRHRIRRVPEVLDRDFDLVRLAVRAEEQE